MRRAGRVLVAAIFAALVLAPTGAGAQATEPWTITNYDILIQVTDDADMLVVENISLDFGSLSRRGIFRYIPVWYQLPDPLPDDLQIDIPSGRDAGDFQRVFKIDSIEVESPSRAPTDLHIEGPEDSNGNVFIRIGHPERFISGAQQYTIRYRVRGALEPLPDSDALAWNAVGTGWPVPIQRATVEIRVPGVRSVRCFQGPHYATDPCEAGTISGGARFATSQPLAPFEAMTFAIELDQAALDVPPVLIDEKPSLRRALIGSAAAVPLGGLTGIGGAALLGMLGWRQGRDRLSRGGVTAHGTVDETQAGERRRGLFEPRAVPVEYRPPDDLRPGHLGLIIDERVDGVDITATIVDLAVRGHLRIEEAKKAGWFRRADWRLIEGNDPKDKAQPFERILLKGLFTSRSDVDVSDLKGTFASTYQKVEAELYMDGQRKKWFADRPDHARSRWLGLGVALTVAGGVLTGLLGARFRMGAVGLVVVVLGLVLMSIHRMMPRRTAKGSALLTRTLGFKEFIDQAETGRMAFAEAENIFIEYLPYAVVFGAVDKWGKAFEGIGVDVEAAVGGFYVGSGPLNLMAFSSGMNDFSSSMSTAMTTAPPSSDGGGFSSGGFSGGGGSSGGGGGGGGGGSW